MLKKIIFILINLLYVSYIYSSIKLRPLDLNPPDISIIQRNQELIRELKYKKITLIEYITDPLILCASLWCSMALTLPIWENTPYFISGSNAGNIFVGRLKLEPFTSGRIDPVTKPLLDSNGNPVRNLNGDLIIVPTGDFFAKNFIEPLFFTFNTFYLRSKNYHPAIMITEVILLSVINEFLVRPFFMNSNFEQLLKNPSVGLIIGILIDELSTFLLTTPYTGLHILAYILNPFNALPTARIKPLLIFNSYKESLSLEVIIKSDFSF